MEVVSVVKNHYIDARQIPSKKEYSVGSDRVDNQQEINVLRIALKKTPFLPQEGRLLHARRACSRTKKGVFLLYTRPFLKKRREQSIKYLDIFCLPG